MVVNKGVTHISVMGHNRVDIGEMDGKGYRGMLIVGQRGGVRAGITLSLGQSVKLAEALFVPGSTNEQRDRLRMADLILPPGYNISAPVAASPTPVAVHPGRKRCPKCGGDGFWHMEVSPAPGVIAIKVDRSVNCPTCQGEGWES